MITDTVVNLSRYSVRLSPALNGLKLRLQNFPRFWVGVGLVLCNEFKTIALDLLLRMKIIIFWISPITHGVSGEEGSSHPVLSPILE